MSYSENALTCRLCRAIEERKALIFWNPPLRYEELCNKHKMEWQQEESI